MCVSTSIRFGVSKYIPLSLIKVCVFLLGTLILITKAQETIPKLPRSIGTIRLPFAAFLDVFRHTSFPDAIYEDQFTLYISTFDAYNFFQKDPKYILRSPGRHIKNLTEFQLRLEVLDETAFWPNDPDFMPKEVVGVEGIAWPSGFLVPGKTKGMVELYDTTNYPFSNPVNIASLDEVDWYYHRTLWKDMDNDGDLDALTARFRTPTASNPIRCELVWFENPNLGMIPGWEQHVLITNGPDVHFRFVDIGNYECILSAEFWNHKLILYCVEKGNWLGNISRIVVDDNVGQPFDCLVDDLNRDGKQELIAMTFNTTIGEGYVKVYEIPGSFPHGEFLTPYEIASGFYAHQIIAGDSMSPGSGKTFYPTRAAEETFVDGRQLKPYMMLSGDDDGKHYILVPRSQAVDNWEYEKLLLVDTRGTTSGKFAVSDLDNDGYTEIIAAGYTTGTLYIYTYRPLRQ